jgi:NAD+ synthase (glutamine-hydrolysing)
MKIALAQLNFHVGNFKKNKELIINAITDCKKKNVDLVVFPELSICGYPPRDFLNYDWFITECINAVNEIANHAIGIAAIVGSPSINPETVGKKLVNSAFFLENGQIKQRIHKALLPTYDVFDEYRYFEPNRYFELIEFKNRKIALTICEDLWDLNSDALYEVSPMKELNKKQPDFAINIAASPFSYSQHSTRKFVLKQNVEHYKLPLIYVNQVGAQTELIFDGGSMVIDADGQTFKQLPFFKEQIGIIEINLANDDAKTFQLLHCESINITPVYDKYELIYQALVLGIKDYFDKVGFKKAIIGLSGGVDSALVTFLAAQALGSENVLAVMMPSEFSSIHSIADSELLCQKLNLKPITLNIERVFNEFQKTLAPQFNNLPFSVAEENIQSRSRGVLLMAMSNKFGYVLLNTSNKSELAVGYGTLYGDMCGALSVIGDLYKIQVYDLCKWINEKFNNVIPEQILTKEPSAELRPNQKDSDSLPDYKVLDTILFEYIENGKGSKELIDAGYNEELVKRILRLVNLNEYKRFQAPPVIRISTKAFGIGRRMPLEGKYEI